MARVALVVPIYNVDQYLDDCLSSLRDQSFKDFEVILVDDGSPDESAAIYKKYLEQDRRFKLLKQNNQGLGPARNNGLKIVDSEFVTFVDSDDRLDTDFLSTMLSYAEQTGSSIVCCGYKMIDIYGEIKLEKKFTESPTLLKNKNDKVILPVNAWGKLFKNNHFEQLVFPPGKYEDLAVVPYITLSAKSVSLIPSTLYHYRITPGSLARENHNDQTNFVALDHLISLFKKSGLFDCYRDELEYIFVRHLLRNRLIEGWPSLSYLRAVNRYGKSNFPKWFNNYYFDTHKGVNNLKLFKNIGPFLFKLYISLRIKLKSTLSRK